MVQNARTPLPAAQARAGFLPAGTRRSGRIHAKPGFAGIAVNASPLTVFCRRVLLGLALCLALTASLPFAPAAPARADSQSRPDQAAIRETVAQETAVHETIVPETAEQDLQAPDNAEEKTSDTDTARTRPGKNADATEKKAEGDAKPASPPATIRLFGTVEFRSLIKNLPKWEHVLNSEKKRPSFLPTGLDAANPQVSERWAKQRAKLEGLPLKEQIQGVNNFFNQWPYKSDLNVWGLEDYWATPREFVNKSGDCEDYAITKYYALRDLGVPASKLRVAAIKDTIRNLGHAVLVVYVENDAYVLDNLTNLVLSHKKLTHYSPQYSVNEEFLWRHVKPKTVPKK